MCGIVNSVDEDPTALGSLTDVTVDGRRRCGDNPPRSVEIGFDELTPHDLNTRTLNLRLNVWGNHSDARSRGNERLDLACRNRAAADDNDFATRQIEEGGKHGAHTDAGTFRRDPTTRSKSARDRPICVGAATRSRTTSAVL